VSNDKATPFKITTPTTYLHTTSKLRSHKPSRTTNHEPHVTLLTLTNVPVQIPALSTVLFPRRVLYPVELGLDRNEMRRDRMRL
jgi:hypothetical protein